MTSPSIGEMKIAASSTYRDVTSMSKQPRRRSKWPISVAILNSLCRGSIVKMKRKGEWVSLSQAPSVVDAAAEMVKEDSGGGR